MSEPWTFLSLEIKIGTTESIRKIKVGKIRSLMAPLMLQGPTVGEWA